MSTLMHKLITTACIETNLTNLNMACPGPFCPVCVLHVCSVTIMPKDMQLARRIRGKHDL